MRSGCCQAQPEALAALFYQRNEQVGQGQRFGAQRCHAAQGLCDFEAVQPALQQRQAHDGLGAALVALNARSRLVVRGKCKGRGVAPPAGERLQKRQVGALGVRGVNPHKRRCAGAAIEVFVTATHREVCARAGQSYRYRACAVGQVPHHQCTSRMGSLGEGGHVVHGAGAVVDMGEHQHRQVLVQVLCNLVRLHKHQRVAALGAQAFGDVQVGRKVAALAQHHAAVGTVGMRNGQRGGQHFVEVDRRGVGGHHFTGPGANQRRNPVPQALGQVKPTRRVPGTNQALTPFLAHHLGGADGGRFGAHAQRVAIQINQPFGY